VPAVRRSEISAELRGAKHQAIADLLAESAARPPPVWAVRAHLNHNVVGVGIGRKIKRGRLLKRPCVRIYVERKIARDALPSRAILPDAISGIETDVIETGRFRAHANGAQKRLRPARPGCSIGFQFPDPTLGDLMAGTLGAVVEADGRRYILSNNHVLANENALPIGTPIFQPGLLDGGKVASDSIAKLARFIPLDPAAHNTVDCAIALFDDDAMAQGAILPKVGKLKTPDPIDAVEGMAVEKTGRATGYTTGSVFDVSATITVQFDLGLLTFADQVLIRGDGGPFSDGGDSGALVVDQKSGRATGLLIGGVPQFAIANHISDVLQNLNVRLVA
jgi:hypothetical protein